MSTDSRTANPSNLVLLRPTLGQGGADRVTIILLKHLDRSCFAPTLVLLKTSGEFVDDAPSDVPLLALNSRNIVTAIPPLTQLLSRQQPDITFSTSSGTNITLVIAHRLSRSRARLVLSERNILFHGGRSAKRRLVVWLKKRLYGRADAIIALSQGVKDDLIAELGLAPNKITVAYSPIDIGDIQSRMKEEIAHPWFKETIPLIVAAGRFVREKDFATLISAFALARKARPLRLVLLGEGPLKAELEGQTRALGIEQDVWFPGFDKNPFKYMARASVFVVSSQHEGLCTVLIQAMACGAPVISTDYQVGAREIIDCGRDGWIVPVADPDMMSRKILELLDQPETRTAFSMNARQSARRFDIETQIKAHEDALLGTRL